MNKYFRIHGDNIIECERTLHLIEESLSAKASLYKGSTLYKPIYELLYKNDVLFIELLSGHDRWGINIGDILERYGGPLREGADSYLTKIEDGEEQIILVIEYCSALPAGNNAWQRSGRAYSSIMAGIPYLYYAEIGGLELGQGREAKAPRYPNPIVPFSYVTASKRMGGQCIPVYRPHPSILPSVYKIYQNTFGINESKSVIRNLITEQNYQKEAEALRIKSLNLVKILAFKRTMHDCLSPEDWITFYETKEPIKWLSDSSHFLKWTKKFQPKVKVTDKFNSFKNKVISLGLGSIGTSNIPISFVPKNKTNAFLNILKESYEIELPVSIEDDLIIVWVYGYKPTGEDSRPDRGLTSLTRMIVGNNPKVLSIVYGPARESTYKTLNKEGGIDTNGLWLSIKELSDFAIFDSVTYPAPLFFKFNNKRDVNHRPVIFDFEEAHLSEFGEHDIDSTIHQIFSQNTLPYIKECFCNPPGGDWSGISYFEGNTEYRWTSLPRVSIIGGKRPDHIIEITLNDKEVFFSIESKGTGRSLEEAIGKNLATYIEDVFKAPPTAERQLKMSWHSYNRYIEISNHEIITIGAFLFKDKVEMHTLLDMKELDAIIAVEFSKDTILHLVYKERGSIVHKILEAIKQNMGHFIIEID